MCARPMPRRRSASPGLLDELCAELADIAQRRPILSRCPLTRRRRAADACGGRAVCRRLLHHADGGGGRQRRGGNPRRDAGCRAARSRLCQQWRRHRAASDRRRAFHRRPDGPAGCAGRHAHDDGRMPTIPSAASRPAAAMAAASRSASPMPSPCWRRPPRRPMRRRPSSPMPSICPAIPLFIRVPANELQPDSDLGDRLVTRDVGACRSRRSRRRWRPAPAARGSCWPPA